MQQARVPAENRPGDPMPRHAWRISRAVICALLAITFAAVLWRPSTALGWIADVVLLAYVGFLGTVMAHEGSHGLLGKGGRANRFWGRLALLPVLVPFANFRR